ncbi:hypothetical protein S40285_01565 [Stachybotrys chlorohalonatus IBT 40285]|uniref:Homeobox domain-containing protein n=1 Tax=Stachybotrys chlorohalonatus (strain IBT 40285) TaxID=1283841 RepID=A0A084QW62_STAC4|nr:hypothetical protein S40285_01565 [Stachybotrys chlorohalonata IBT 40285]
MIVARHHSSEQSHWPLGKIESSPLKPASPRMSNHYDTSLSTQPEWQGQYPYLSHSEGPVFPQSYEHNQSPTSVSPDPSKPRVLMGRGEDSLSIHSKDETNTNLAQHESLDQLDSRQTRRPSPIMEQEEIQSEGYGAKTSESLHDEPLLSTGTPSLSMGSNALSSASSAGHGSDMVPNSVEEPTLPLKEEEEEEEDLVDEDMLDGDNDNGGPPQTAAERAAARRKMKRFRLTHQQTRFLMSEFAKQPHPDAAHRERLSREIPGLSPRQVQVWFQNRRAKIKRLTADDRERMIKMRAVPDDFDNVQALHSPYGAVHGMSPSLASPVDYGNQQYGDPMLRPLLIDVRRHEADDHMSPTGLTPSFGSIGFHPAGSISSPDIMSPLSPASTDRYGYGSQVSTPMSSAPRSANPFIGRQNSLDATLQMNRQGFRPLQPLHLRDPISRSRSESLQSPLRSSMSWKGNTVDYSTAHGASSSPTMPERQSSVYQPGHMGGAPSGGYESHSYSGGSNMPNQPGMGYSAHQNRSRVRANTATLPLNLDISSNYRSSTAGVRSPSIGSANRDTTSSPFNHSSIYTTSYPPAPLTAPLEFAPSTAAPRTGMQDYSAPQMSAPIAAPSDFSQALHGNLPGQVSRTPMRESFGGGGPLAYGQDQDRLDSYGKDVGGNSGTPKRERSFTLSADPANHTIGS